MPHHTTKEQRCRKRILDLIEYIQHKNEIMARHMPGTCYHTRAMREGRTGTRADTTTGGRAMSEQQFYIDKPRRTKLARPGALFIPSVLRQSAFAPLPSWRCRSLSCLTLPAEFRRWLVIVGAGLALGGERQARCRASSRYFCKRKRAEFWTRLGPSS